MMTKTGSSNPYILAVCIFLVSAVFLADILLPLGVAITIPYSAAIIVALFSSYRRFPLILAATCSVLTIVGYFLSPPGSVLWVTITNRGSTLFVLWVVAVTGMFLQRSQANLIVSEASSRKIIDSAQIAFLILDPQGCVVSFNPCLENITGWRSAEVKGQKWFTVFLPAENRKKELGDFKRILGGEHLGRRISPVLTKGGNKRMIEWDSVPLTDDKDHITGLLRTGIDVTERMELEQKIVRAAEEERHHIAQDLHDSLGSFLTGIDYRMKALANECSGQKLALKDEAIAISKLIRTAIKQTRGIAKGLHPLGSHPEDLMIALNSLVAETSTGSNVRCRFRCQTPVLIDDPATANHLYRITQEAIANAIKHSGATFIAVSLTQKNDRTILKVLDDGVGFDFAGVETGNLGLKTMNYRAHAINGTLTINRRRKSGTEVACSVPKRS